VNVSHQSLQQAERRQLYTLSEASSSPQPVASLTELSRLAADNPAALAAAVAALGLSVAGMSRLFDSGSRAYQGKQTVGAEYDAWTEEGVLEYYWGEHIHLGTYTEAERKAGWWKKDFKAAKYDFIDDMLAFSGTQQPKSILDVGCGFGGTSRHLAKKFKDAQVKGAWRCTARAACGCSMCAALPHVARHVPLLQASRCRPSKWSVAQSLQSSRACLTPASRCVR
jgi:MPBQ/MSBQ methyltransferase